MRNDLLFALSALFLSLLAIGCPKSGSGSKVSPLVVEEVGSNSDCSRGLSGDMKTIKSRLGKGRVEEARVYVMAQAHCEQALGSSEFLLLAAGVFEELGELNAAWRASTTALAWGRTDGNTLTVVGIEKQLTRFAVDYVWLEGGSAESKPPEIRYAGAVMDSATRAQLDEVAANLGVEGPEGQWGFWLYPGRFLLRGEAITAHPGDRIQGKN